MIVTTRRLRSPFCSTLVLKSKASGRGSRVLEKRCTCHISSRSKFLHALRRLSLRGTLSPERARLALSRLKDTQFIRYPHSTFLERIWSLRNNLTTYDATYVALAEALDAPLVTMDARLAQAPDIRAVVEVYGNVASKSGKDA